MGSSCFCAVGQVAVEGEEGGREEVMGCEYLGGKCVNIMLRCSN
jgi:hypothetical protein